MITLVCEPGTVRGFVVTATQDGKQAVVLLGYDDLMPFKQSRLLPVPPGSWFLTPSSELLIGCPKCGGQLVIPRGHARVAPDGGLEPAVICPAPGCGARAWVRLEGWKPRQLVVLGDAKVNGSDS